MPIFEYVCPTCKGSFEKLVRGGRKAREATVSCPSCGQDSRRKKITLVAAVSAGGSNALASAAANCAPSG